VKAFFGVGLAETDRSDYSHFVRWRNNRRTCRFFSNELQQSIKHERGQSEDDLALPKEFNSWGTLERAQFLEINIFMSQYLLSSQGDRPAMAHSVEGRFPFLDYRLVEFCRHLPARVKLKGLTEKYLLRQAARDWLPSEILARVKRPYRAPIHKSFFNEARMDYVRDLLDPGAIRANGFFNPSAVSQLVAKIEQGRPLSETDDMALVGIISTELVQQQFVSDFRPAPPLSDMDDVKVVDRKRVPA
jgi:asparagine synthase (glutamine-hydrolysing)